MAATITVELAYAESPFQQFVVTLQLPSVSTIATAIQHSGVLMRYPNLDLTKNRVGIHGCHKTLTDSVQAGDRVEIYRPLTADPREIRRARALQQKNREDR
jgi:uncharacterized protein